MHYSDIALKVLVAKEMGLIKSNAQFAANFFEQEKFEKYISNNSDLDRIAETILYQFTEHDDDEGFICTFDKEFPVINSNVKNGDRPYLLFYKGDISLLRDLNRNVAVIGLIDPTQKIIERETEVITQLVESGLIIVSGLAKGCDAVAHKVCVDARKKTVAILPSTISKITPSVNRDLAKDIVSEGGLLLTEYYKEPASRNDAIRRFIERDRLQAMFSKTVIMIASYRKNEGDSGSRHAMEAAQAYAIERYVMYNKETDIDDKQFGLNKDLLQYGTAKILNKNSIETIKNIVNSRLVYDPNFVAPKQLELY